MIDINIVSTTNQDTVFWDMTAVGHAEAGPPGQDIVCAAVSTLCDTLCDSLMAAADDGHIPRPQCERAGGFYSVSAEVPHAWISYGGSIATTVISTILRGLRLVEEAYPQNLCIHFRQIPDGMKIWASSSRKNGQNNTDSPTVTGRKEQP